MAAKRTTRTRRKKAEPGGVTAYAKRSREIEQIEKKGGCDGNPATLAKTNGVAQTLMWIENTGTCPLTFYCTDRQGNTIRSTSHTVPPTDNLRSYSSPTSAHAIMINCPQNDDEDATCQFEMDA